jgi:hypothetical protein
VNGLAVRVHVRSTISAGPAALLLLASAARSPSENRSVAPARASGWIQRGDSAPRQIAREFTQAVFAFNEVPLIVCSVRYAAGLAVIVPLFSEADADLERDTITVVADPALGDGRGAWIVRFTDPVIAQRYVVDGTSRRTVAITTQQRRSGTVFDARSP